MDPQSKEKVIKSSISLFNKIKKRWEEEQHLEPHDIEYLLSMVELYFKSKY